LSEWKFRLDEIAEIVDCEHKTAPTVDSSIYRSIRTTDITNGIIDYNNANCVDYETYLEWTKRAIPEAHDIILAREAPVGEVGWIREGKQVCLGQRTVLIKVKSDNVSKRFLLYYLINPETKYELQVQSVGSVVSHLNMKNIRAFYVSLPPIHEQEAIASVLSSLDDKIDLLHRQNKTLEAMAEALFRQWFVEEAGEDWEKKSLYDCINLIGGGTPKTSVDEYWNGDICWISAKDITPNHKGVICSTEKKITTEGLNSSSTRMLPRFSTIISARGTVGKYALLLDDMAFSQSNYGIIPKYKKCYFFTYMLVANVVDDLVGAAYGSVFDTITTKTFQEQYVTVPLEKEIIDFEKEISPLFLKVLNNSKQIRTLEKLRDTLLPKLMSGEVRVAC
jgi:type I restriction enzyme, S subunit